MLNVRYIRYSHWTALSAGTRSPIIAAGQIRAGNGVYEASNDRFLGFAAQLRVPPLIVVTALATVTGARGVVVLEGHARFTAYALAPGAIPDELGVLVDASPAIARWDEY